MIAKSEVVETRLRQDGPGRRAQLDLRPERARDDRRARDPAHDRRGVDRRARVDDRRRRSSSGCERVAKRHELVHEVRGRGLMIGIEFSRPRSMRLRAQWTLLESMRTGLFTQMVIVPLFRDHGILIAGRGRPPERAEDPAAAHHDRRSRPTSSSTRSTTCSATSSARSGLLFGVGRSLAIPALKASR